MNCVIVEDDPVSRKQIKQCIDQTPFLKLVGQYRKVEKLLEALEIQKIDLIFLDIVLSGQSGVDFVKTHKNLPQVIFVSNYRNFAVEAFDYDVTDYLLKPIDYERFLKAVKKAKAFQDNTYRVNKQPERIYIKSKSSGELIHLELNDILYFESQADYVECHTKSGNNSLFLSTLKGLYTQLPEKKFVRIHKSYIINIDNITKMRLNEVQIGSITLQVSRTYKMHFREKLNLLKNKRQQREDLKS